MSKNPAFQFYPNDWSRDLEEHPLEIEGAWIRICCKLWWSTKRGSVTRALQQWSRILRESLEKTLYILQYIQAENIGYVTPPLQKFSSENLDGNVLVTVESRRMTRDEKERELTRLRVKKYREKQPCNDPVTPMKQYSSSSSSIIYLSDSQEIGLSELLFSLILKNNPKAKKPNFQSWAVHIDRLHRIDKREYSEIESVIRWSQKDTFWLQNILSTEKLRKQFDRLWLKMGNKPTVQYESVE